MTLPCSKLSLVDTALSQLVDVSNKADFAVALAAGLGHQMKTDYIESLIQQVGLK